MCKEIAVRGYLTGTQVIKHISSGFILKKEHAKHVLVCSP